MTTDTNRIEAGNSALVLTERIHATPDQIFDYLVDRDKLLRWMGTDATIDPTPGGVFNVNINGRDVASGAYVEVDRPSKVVFTWGWEGSADVPPGSSTVEIALRADGADTIVELTHAGLPGGQGDPHRDGWTHYLARLVVAGAGGDPGHDSYRD
ncbi:MAG: SRPBCC family protein [Actinomycetota bacterium]